MKVNRGKMMKQTVLKITASDLDAENFYVGATDVADFAGSIEISAGLGCVKFRGSLCAKFRIIAAAGSGIEAGLGIEAGSGIEAGEGIKAGWGIKAGEGIEAGSGIEAGLSIAAKWISARLRIFAGICSWRLPNESEAEIIAELRSGIIAFGTLKSPVAADATGEKP